MRKVIACVLFLLLGAACAQPSGTTLATPIATGTVPASPTTSPGTASTLSCRLPVISPTAALEPPGGWITFPSGDFARDPSSLHGRLQAHVPSYDQALGYWVPVERRYVAPDGNSYILQNDSSLPSPNDLFVVDAKNGKRRLVLSAGGPAAAPGSWQVVAYANEGVYLWSQGMKEIPGLWLLNPATGGVRLLDAGHYWGMVAGGVAWALEPVSGASSKHTALYQLNLGTHKVTKWYESNAPLRLLAPTPDGGVLIADGEYGSALVELLVAPDQAMPTEQPPGIGYVEEAFQAEPGIWLPLPIPGGGLALYTKESGMKIVTQTTEVFSVAGGCQ
jgi:hypothetical protein